MNSSDPLLAALRDRKLFSGPRPGLVSLMDLDGGAAQGVQVDGVALWVPRDLGSRHSRFSYHDHEYISPVRLGFATAVPLTEKPVSTSQAEQAGWPRPQGAAGLGNDIIPNSQVNKLFSLNYRKGKNKQRQGGPGCILQTVRNRPYSQFKYFTSSCKKELCCNGTV